jgi:hypothetical protein
MNLVATTFATQPVCSAVRAAHTLRTDQNYTDRGPGCWQQKISDLNELEISVILYLKSLMLGPS